MRKKLLPLLIVPIAIMVLFGNFIFFNFLLKKSENDLIEKTGKIELSKHYIKTDSPDISLIDIIANTVPSQYYMIEHQPFENQLSMNEAIQVSKGTIKKFIQNGIILNTNDIEKRIENEENYSLHLHTQVNSIVQLNPLYSSWYIEYDDNKLHMNIKLNAVTGDILRLSVIESLENNEQNLNIKSKEEILDIYLTYLKLENLKTDVSTYNDMLSRCKLKDTNIDLTVSYSFDEKNYYLSIVFTNNTQVFDN